MEMNFNDLYWHDGNLVKLECIAPQNEMESAAVEFTCELFENNDYKERSRFKIGIHSVSDISFMIDLSELKFHAGAGMIVEAKRSKIENRATSQLYEFTLQTGKILIYAEGFSASKVIT